jgi:hypothetical protein
MGDVRVTTTTPARQGSAASWLNRVGLGPLPVRLAAEHALNDGHDLLHDLDQLLGNVVTGTANCLCSIRSACESLAPLARRFHRVTATPWRGSRGDCHAVAWLPW